MSSQTANAPHSCSYQYAHREVEELTAAEHQLSWYAFLGRVLGKAIYDGILVDVSFAGFFCES